MTRRSFIVTTLVLCLGYSILSGITPAQAADPRLTLRTSESHKIHDNHPGLAHFPRRARKTRGIMNQNNNNAAVEPKITANDKRDILNATLDSVSNLLGTPLLGSSTPNVGEARQKCVVAQ